MKTFTSVFQPRCHSTLLTLGAVSGVPWEIIQFHIRLLWRLLRDYCLYILSSFCVYMVCFMWLCPSVELFTQVHACLWSFRKNFNIRKSLFLTHHDPSCSLKPWWAPALNSQCNGLLSAKMCMVKLLQMVQNAVWIWSSTNPSRLTSPHSWWRSYLELPGTAHIQFSSLLQSSSSVDLLLLPEQSCWSPSLPSSAVFHQWPSSNKASRSYTTIQSLLMSCSPMVEWPSALVRTGKSPLYLQTPLE